VTTFCGTVLTHPPASNAAIMGRLMRKGDPHGDERS
jgi:hypothetical protein